VLSTQPSFSWSVAVGGGKVNTSGLYTAPTTKGTAQVKAASGDVSEGLW
jgi:hypothetical protein